MCLRRLTVFERYCNSCFYKCKKCKKLFLSQAELQSLSVVNERTGTVAKKISLDIERVCDSCGDDVFPTENRKLISVLEVGPDGKTRIQFIRMVVPNQKDDLAHPY